MDVEVSPDGRYAAVPSVLSDTVSFIDLSTLTVAASVSVTQTSGAGEPYRVASTTPREFEAAPKVKGHELHALMILTMAATYAPEADAPLGIRLPVDLHTCELDPERWTRWLAHDPVRMVEDEPSQASLAGLRGLFIDCGSRDQYFLHYGARILSKRLTAAGIEHVHQEFDDNHSSIDYRLDTSLPYLYRALRS